MDRCSLTTSALGPVKFLTYHLPPWPLGQEKGKSINMFQPHKQSKSSHIPGPGWRLSIISEIVFSSLAPSCLPEDSPGQGRRGRRAQVKDSGSGSLECTGRSKEGKVALKFCLFTADCNLLRAQAMEEPSSACVLTVISKKNPCSATTTLDLGLQ